MNTELENKVQEIHKQTVHFNRGKYAELLNNPQLQSTLHSRFRMFSHLTTRTKLFWAGVVLLGVTTIVGTTGYYLHFEKGLQGQDVVKHPVRIDDNEKDYTNALICCYYSPPDNYPEIEITKNKFEPTINQDQLQKLRVLELNKKELGELGIFISADSIQFLRNQEGASERLQYTLSSDYRLKDGYPTNEVTLPSYVKIQNIQPRMITDTLGNVRFTMYRYNEVNPELAKRAYKLEHQFSTNRKDPTQITKDSVFWQLSVQSVKLFNPTKLVPILVRTTAKKNSKSNKLWLPNAIMWYDATPELLQLLPKNATTRLLNSPVPRPETLGSYFDARSPQERSLDSTYAIYNILVYPNPVTGKTTTVRYNLHKEETISISLSDINGNMIEQLQQPTLRTQIVNEDVIHLPKLDPGVYLIVVANSNGIMRAEQIMVSQ